MILAITLFNVDEEVIEINEKNLVMTIVVKKGLAKHNKPFDVKVINKTTIEIVINKNKSET